MLPAATPELLRRDAASFLLRAEYGVVPFRGRADLLDELRTWSAEHRGLGVWLLHGSGGTGKTRLAAELCRRLQLEGSEAGFLEGSPTPEALERLTALSVPVLVVIDEADARVREVAAVLRGLARLRPAAPVGVLLARGVGQWWQQLLVPELCDDPDADFARRATIIRELGPVDETPAARQQAFRSAADAFADRIGLAGSSPVVPDVSEPLPANVLFLHLVALSAFEAASVTVRRPPSDDALLAAALERETGYWARSAVASGIESLTPVALQRAVAVATLVPVSGEDEAASALTAVPEFNDAAQERLRTIAHWLHDLYPPLSSDLAWTTGGRSWLGPLMPEPLGEALVASVLEGSPSMATSMLARVQPARAWRTVFLLMLAAHTSGRTAAAVTRSLAENLATHWVPAVNLANSVGDPMATLLADALLQHPRPEVAAQIERALRPLSDPLRELGVIAGRQALDYANEFTRPVVGRAEAARLNSGLATRLAELGRYEEALSPAHEAVQIYEQLSKRYSLTLLPGVAAALTGLSDVLWAVDRREDSIATLRRAIKLNRRLAKRQGSAFPARVTVAGRTQRDLSLGDQMFLDGRMRDARPGGALVALADSLAALARRLSESGLRYSAKRAGDEAVRIYGRRVFDEQQPGFLPDFASAVEDGAAMLRAGGHPEAALTDLTLAVNAWRRAAGRDPRCVPQLLVALESLSALLTTLHRDEEARAASEEATTALRRFPEYVPG
jgi:tetratricopeptide (TPR) repeat protein